ncbi:hypothetical protein SLS57_008876 [Botryosphaeria dothidea]
MTITQYLYPSIGASSALLSPPSSLGVHSDNNKILRLKSVKLFDRTINNFTSTSVHSQLVISMITTDAAIILSTSPVPLSAAAIQTYHTNWVRAAERTLQRLQTSIDHIHLRIFAALSTETLDEKEAVIQSFNARVTRLLSRVWFVELNDKVAESMNTIGLQIMLLVNEWEGLKTEVEERLRPFNGFEGDIEEESDEAEE